VPSHPREKFRRAKASEFGPIAPCYHPGMDRDTQAVTIRWPRDLHERMKAIAEHQNRSLNNLIVTIAKDVAERYKRERGA
jgi:hypothetical protein